MVFWKTYSLIILTGFLLFACHPKSNVPYSAYVKDTLRSSQQFIDSLISLDETSEWNFEEQYPTPNSDSNELEEFELPNSLVEVSHYDSLIFFLRNDSAFAKIERDSMPILSYSDSIIAYKTIISEFTELEVDSVIELDAKREKVNTKKLDSISIKKVEDFEVHPDSIPTKSVVIENMVDSVSKITFSKKKDNIEIESINNDTPVKNELSIDSAIKSPVLKVDSLTVNSGEKNTVNASSTLLKSDSAYTHVYKVEILVKNESDTQASPSNAKPVYLLIELADSLKSQVVQVLRPEDLELFKKDKSKVDTNSLEPKKIEKIIANQPVKTVGQNKINVGEQSKRPDFIHSETGEINDQTKKLEGQGVNKTVDSPLVKDKTGEDSISSVFYFNTGVIAPIDYTRQIEAFISAYPVSKKSIIYLSSYTDGSGSKSRNKSLSLDRVEFIKDELVKRGYSEQQIFMQYFGENYSKAEVDEYQRKVVLVVKF